MDIKLITKKCPNCGANLKFNMSDTSVTCEYCGTYALIEHDRKNMYTTTEPGVNRIYVNKAGEVFKWVSRAIISAMLLIFGIMMCSLSSPIYGVILIFGAILTMLPISIKGIDKIPHLRAAIIAIIFFVGFFGGCMSMYELPSEFQGKYVSDTSGIIVEIKGNNIKVTDGDYVVKEKLYTWEETWGHVTYHNIKVNNGEYEFRLVDHGGVEFQFYERAPYGTPKTFYYNTKNKSKYICEEKY
ncbi:MAG: hypothetical protein J6J36_04875 [Clostridia bacterium]|nr:hypothetical protein [Clostridia bacterium]